jgi:hypothetical protein
MSEIARGSAERGRLRQLRCLVEGERPHLLSSRGHDHDHGHAHGHARWRPQRSGIREWFDRINEGAK